MLDRLSVLYGRFLEALAAIACVLIFLMMLMICLDVLLRNVALVESMPGLAWSNDLTEVGLYLITMLSAPMGAAPRQASRVDVVAARESRSTPPGTASGSPTSSRSPAAW